jgi:hypothetical protein
MKHYHVVEGLQQNNVITKTYPASYAAWEDAYSIAKKLYIQNHHTVYKLKMMTCWVVECIEEPNADIHTRQ